MAIEGDLFNGQIRPVTYTVTAFDGSRQVAQQVLDNVPATDAPSGFAHFALTTGYFTKIEFTPSNLTRFDYFLGNLRITYTLVRPGPVPTP